MAKLIKYDVTGVEESGGGTGVKVPPGVRVAEIVSCSQRTEKSNGEPANDLQVVMNFGPEYDWGYMYIGLSEAAEWKMAEFVRALAMKEKGSLDPDKLKGKLLRVKVNTGEYQGEYSPNFGKLYPAQDGDEVGGKASQLSTAAGPDIEDGEDDPSATQTAGEFVPTREDPEDEEVGSYDDWSDEDVAAEVEDRGLTLPGGRGSARVKGLKALRDDDAEAAAGGGGDDAEPAAAETTDADDYEEWSTDDLKKEWEDRKMGDLPAVRGRNAEDRLRSAIIDELRKDDAENPFEA